MTIVERLLPGVVCGVLLSAMACGRSAGPTGPAPPVTTTPPTGVGRFDVSLPGAGITLGGSLYRPEIAQGVRAAVIVLHGWQAPGTNGAATVEARAQRLAAAGYVALALSMRGWPPSGGTDDCGLNQPADILRAVNWMATQPGVTADRIGLVGFSQGGQVALLAGAAGAPVRAIVAYFPVTDVARWKATTTHVDIPNYITSVCEPGGVDRRSPSRQAASVTAPVLIVHGDADTRVPTEQAFLMRDALQQANKRVELFLVPGAQHGFTAAEEAVVGPVVDAFLARELG